MNLSALKVIIPFAFLVIIIECLAKLGYDNRQLKTDNQYLQKESRELTNKNNGLANTLQNLTEAVTSMNNLVDKEAKRRAAAEMKSQRLNEEVKDALKGHACTNDLIPADAVIRLLNASDSSRRGKGKKPAASSKSSD